MNAPITQFYRSLIDQIRVGDRYMRFDITDEQAAQLIAGSEARAVALAVTALTCTHHNDQQRAACPVCLVAALAAERDQLRAARDECERQFQDKVRRLGEEVEVTNQLRAEVERLKGELHSVIQPRPLYSACARTDGIEGVSVAWEMDFFDYENRFPCRSAIDSAMKEGAK